MQGNIPRRPLVRDGVLMTLFERCICMGDVLLKAPHLSHTSQGLSCWQLSLNHACWFIFFGKNPSAVQVKCTGRTVCMFRKFKGNLDDKSGLFSGSAGGKPSQEDLSPRDGPQCKNGCIILLISQQASDFCQATAR